MSKLTFVARLALMISRPRFWPYLAGPYLIGVAASSATFFYREPNFWLLLVFFAVPANLFLYGINDYYDADTDQSNPKKQTSEHLLAIEERGYLRFFLAGTSALCVLAIIFSDSLLGGGTLVSLWFLSYAYSAPPLRFKKRPYLDSASNILYILPGIIGYAQHTGSLAPWHLLLSGALWAAAMHLFSAIPDIVSDREAGITTTAVRLGKRQALLVCSLLWGFGFLLSSESLSAIAPWSLLLIIYPFIPLYALLTHRNILRIYWWFPVINAVNGALLFFGILLNK